MLINYHVLQVNTNVYAIERLGIRQNVRLVHWKDQNEAEAIARLLLLEAQDVATDARNETLLDIRREIFQGIRPLRIPSLSALPHVAKAKRAEDIAISIVVTEMADALNELAALRRIIAECVSLSDLLRMGYSVPEGNALIAECEMLNKLQGE